MDKILEIINQVCASKGSPLLNRTHSTMRLREDLGFTSLDLAELTVRIEEKFDVDVFADGLVFTVGEIEERLRRGETEN